MALSITLTAESSDKIQLAEVKEVLESIRGLYLEYNKKNGSDPSFIPAPPWEGALTEPEFFDWMNHFRQALGNKIDSDDILVVLTSREIANRHFNGIDFKNRHIFVDLNNWETNYLPDSPSKYPVAYHVFLSILLVIYFKDIDTASAALHWEDKGCILDYNIEKTKVELKMLTARICPVCMGIFLARNPDTNLLAYFRSGLEKIRHDMVEGEYYRKIKPKPMRLTFKKDFSFHFEGIGSLKLDPAHTLVYLYFLEKKEKYIYFKEVKKDVERLNQLFLRLKAIDSPKEVQQLNSVVIKACGLKYVRGKLVEDPNNAMSERASVINREIAQLLGTFGLQLYFQIENNEGRHGVNKDIDFKDDTGLTQLVRGPIHQK